MASGWGDRYRKQLLNQDDEGGEKISPGGEHPATDEEAVVVGDDERTERSCHEMGSNGGGGECIVDRAGVVTPHVIEGVGVAR